MVPGEGFEGISRTLFKLNQTKTRGSCYKSNTESIVFIVPWLIARWIAGLLAHFCKLFPIAHLEQLGISL